MDEEKQNLLNVINKVPSSTIGWIFAVCRYIALIAATWGFLYGLGGKVDEGILSFSAFILSFYVAEFYSQTMSSLRASKFRNISEEFRKIDERNNSRKAS